MSTEDNNNDGTTNICANCGKEGDLKACTACNMVKYCNRDCQIAHRPQHKKECKKRAAELYDEKLFKEVEHEECPICFVPMPVNADNITFHICCGKNICKGCIFAMVANAVEEGEVPSCAYCRTPATGNDEKDIKRIKILMEKGNGDAFYHLAGYYAHGINGLPQDHQKANELLERAAELGCALAHYHLGTSYHYGHNVEMNRKKAKYYYELAAVKGHLKARYNLSGLEGVSGNHHRATRHMLIAARAGDSKSLEAVKILCQIGTITNDEYSKTLRAYQKIQDEMKSETRDKAAQFIGYAG